MHGSPDRPRQQSHPFSMVKQSMRELEEVRLILRYAEQDGQLCFLV